jgi:predicted Zn-dependent protease
MTRKSSSATSGNELVAGVSERHALMLFEAAHAWMGLGQLTRADETLEGLCALVPGFHLGWLGRGLVAQSSGRHRDALAYLRKAQSAAPTSGLVRLQLGEVLIALNHPAEAGREFESALRLEPTGTVADVARARLAQLKPQRSSAPPPR